MCPCLELIANSLGYTWPDLLFFTPYFTLFSFLFRMEFYSVLCIKYSVILPSLGSALYHAPHCSTPLLQQCKGRRIAYIPRRF